MAASPLDLSTEHLRTVSELYAAIRQDAVESDAESTDALRLSRENIRQTKHLLLNVQKLRRSPRTHAAHVRSHANRMTLEKVWEQHLRRLSNTLVGQMDLDSAISAAHRAWITPPPEPVDGVFVDPAITKSRFARVRKKLSPIKPDDLEKMQAWGGTRSTAAQLAVKYAEAQGTPVYVMRDPKGDPLAVAAVKAEGGVFHIQYLAASPGGGNGTRMMQELAKTAKADGLGMALDSVPAAEKFYQGIGMRSAGKGSYGWTPSEVAAFASTAGVLAPQGARTPGTTSAENMGAQQLALNALQGVPPGQRGGVEDVKRALTSTVNEASWLSGGSTEYLGLATQTAEQAGQVSLEHLGLGKTFEFANPQNMARDTFGVRGSKVIEQMYGNHVDTLTKIITDATDPRNPKTISEVKASIRETWPDLQTYQVERIARTETASVWMTTAANAYAANGISQFETIVATGPSIGVESEDPCDECVDMAADVHSMDDDLPPWHPNCRCEVIPVLEDSDGTPWLPPDEPWAGGGDGAEPVPGYEQRTAPAPGDQLNQYGQADLQHLDPALAVETPIPDKYVNTIDNLGLNALPWEMPKGELGTKIYGDYPDTRYLHQIGWKLDENGNFVPGQWTAERRLEHQKDFAQAFDGKIKPGPGEKPQVFFTAGGGASGKGSSMFTFRNPDGSTTEMSLDELENDPRIVYINPDTIKATKPEYKALIEAGAKNPREGLYAAAGVHEESSVIAREIAQKAMDEGYNVVIDQTGSKADYLDKIKAFKDKGYETQVTMMSAPTNTAIKRSIDRAGKVGGKSEGRFVSVKELERAHAGASKVMPLWQGSDAVDSWRVYDNSGSEAKLVAHGVGGGDQTILDSEAYDKVRAKALQGTQPPAPVVPAVDISDPLVKDAISKGSLGAPDATYFHGSGGTGGAPLSIGIANWDKRFFITPDQKVAEHYADRYVDGEVREVKLDPTAQVFTPSLAAKDYTPERLNTIIRYAESKKYDAVHFGGGVGTVVLNESKVVSGGREARYVSSDVPTAPAGDFGVNGESPGAKSAYAKLTAPLTESSDAEAQAHAAKIIGADTTPPAEDELVVSPWNKLDVAGKNYNADSGLTWAYEHKGVVVRIETNYDSMSMGLSLQDAKRYQEAINTNLDSWESSHLEKLQTVTYSQGASPWNADFAERAGIKEFHAAAQAVQGNIFVWDGARYAGRQDIFDHEMGHIVGKDNGAPLPVVWQNARKEDLEAVGNQKYVSYTGNWTGWTVGMRGSVSEYGSTADVEDWAESVRLYMADKRYGSIGEGVVQGTTAPRVPVRFAEVWPNRAALLDKWLFGPGALDRNPLIEAVDQQITGLQLRLEREMKFRGDRQAEANIKIIEHKLGVLQQTRIEYGGAAYTDDTIAVLKTPSAYMSAAPAGAKFTVPDVPGAASEAGTWVKQDDGKWKQGGRTRESTGFDMVTAAAMTVLLPGPHLGLGVMADVVAWSIFAAQLQGYVGGVSFLGQPIYNPQPSDSQAKRDALARRAGVAARPQPKPSSSRQRRSS